MRHLLLALMIALLPLRGWVGDVMAAQMTSTVLSQSATESHHGMDDATRHVMAEASDCSGHQAGASEDASAQADCSTCTVCQICHSVALTPLLMSLPSAMLPGGQVQTSHVHFASAERAPGFKPPIS